MHVHFVNNMFISDTNVLNSTVSLSYQVASSYGKKESNKNEDCLPSASREETIGMLRIRRISGRQYKFLLHLMLTSSKFFFPLEMNVRMAAVAK